MTLEQRLFNSARNTLQKDAEFLGFTLDQLLEDIKSNGTNSYPLLVRDAYNTYTRSIYYV